MRRKRLRASLFILLGMTVVFDAQAENYMDRMITNLRPGYEKLPEAIQPIYSVALRARKEQKSDTALEAFTNIAEIVQRDAASIDPNIATYFLAQLALSQEVSNKYPLAMKTLEQIRQLRSEPEAEEIRYLADLERMRLMNQSGGHPDIPEFDPSIEEKEKQAKFLFETYSPYRQEILKAHVEFAQDACQAALSDRTKFRYLQIAIEQLKEVRDIAMRIQQNPALAQDERTVRGLDYFLQYTELNIPQWEKLHESISPETVVLSDLAGPQAAPVGQTTTAEIIESTQRESAAAPTQTVPGTAAAPQPKAEPTSTGMRFPVLWVIWAVLGAGLLFAVAYRLGKASRPSSSGE